MGIPCHEKDCQNPATGWDKGPGWGCKLHRRDPEDRGAVCPVHHTSKAHTCIYAWEQPAPIPLDYAAAMRGFLEASQDRRTFEKDGHLWCWAPLNLQWVCARCHGVVDDPVSSEGGCVEVIEHAVVGFIPDPDERGVYWEVDR